MGRTQCAFGLARSRGKVVSRMERLGARSKTAYRESGTNRFNPIPIKSLLVALPVKSWTWAISPQRCRASGQTYPAAKSFSKSSFDSLAPSSDNHTDLFFVAGRRCNPFGAVNPLRSKEDFSKRVFRSRQTDSSGTMQELPVPTFPHQCPCGTSRNMSS